MPLMLGIALAFIIARERIRMRLKHKRILGAVEFGARSVQTVHNKADGAQEP